MSQQSGEPTSSRLYLWVCMLSPYFTTFAEMHGQAMYPTLLVFLVATRLNILERSIESASPASLPSIVDVPPGHCANEELRPTNHQSHDAEMAAIEQHSVSVVQLKEVVSLSIERDHDLARSFPQALQSYSQSSLSSSRESTDRENTPSTGAGNI